VMKFEHLKTFHYVAHAGSFTRAAQKLFITQPTVTQHIQALEQELNVQLIYRSKSDTRLTPAGRLLLQNVDAIFDILDEMKTSFQSHSDVVTGDLAIGTSTIMGTYFLPHFIIEFIKHFTGVRISLHYGNSHTIAEWIENGIVDFGFAPYAIGFTKLDFTFVHREKVRFAVGPDHPLATQEKLDISELADIPFFIREKGSQISDVVTKWLNVQAWPDKAPPLVICTDIDAIKKIVEKGAGVTALPESALEREFSMGLLHELPIYDESLYVDYYLVRRQNPAQSQATGSFLELFTEMGGLDLDRVKNRRKKT